MIYHAFATDLGGLEVLLLVSGVLLGIPALHGVLSERASA